MVRFVAMDQLLRDRWLSRADQTLSTAGRRSGAARTAVVELLAREGQCLMSAQEIVDRIDRAASPSSVYRTLDELTELGLLHHMTGRDGVTRYEIVDPRRRHHHIVEEPAGTVRPFTDPELDRAIEDAAARLGVQLTDHEVVIRGRRALALAALPFALLFPAPAEAQVLADGHVDYAARIVDERLRSLVKTDAGWREPSAVTWSVVDAARTTVPASAPFLGRPGESVWVLPQVQQAGVLWPGWNTEELTGAQVSGPVAWRLDAVSGPGDFTLFQSGVFGEPDVVFRSADGLPDTRSVPLGTHAHGNWVFTREGAYRLTFTMSATLAGGTPSQDTQTLAVQVGKPAAVEPTPTATPSPGASATPAPHEADKPPAPDTATAPTLRALAATVRGRTLTLRVRLDRTSRVSVTLRRSGKTSARVKPRVLRAGTRTLRLTLSRRPSAGRHTVRVTASADGRSTTRTRTVRVR